MNAAACQVLATVFPIVMLTIVLERRMVSLPLRRRNWFRQLMIAAFTFALIGLAVTLVGVQFDGLAFGTGLFAWSCALLSIGGLAVVLLAAMATIENEEDATADEG